VLREQEGSFAKETYHLKEPTNRSPPIPFFLKETSLSRRIFSFNMSTKEETFKVSKKDVKRGDFQEFFVKETSFNISTKEETFKNSSCKNSSCKNSSKNSFF